MSPLWPERLHAGLFPSGSWLRGSGEVLHAPALAGADSAPDALLQALDQLLQQRSDRIGRSRWRARLDLTVSDGLAALAPMAWQEQLVRRSEVLAYGRVCMEQGGLAELSDWSLHADYRSHGAMGLAYALPNAWIAGFEQVADRHGVRLQRVLPMTARAYFGAGRGPRRGLHLLAVEEARRIAALAFAGRKVVGLEVEPLAGDRAAGIRRLMTRMAMRLGPMERGSLWRCDWNDGASAEEAWEGAAATVQLEIKGPAEWSRWA